MSHHHALAHWQNTLRQVLSDYVNGNFLRVRVKWAFPFAWGVSAYSTEYALRKLVQAAYPLARHFKTPALTAYLHQLNSQPLADGEPEMALLAALTQGYLLLSELVRHQPEGCTDAVHLEHEFKVSTYQRTDPVYFPPVVRLAHFIRQQMAPYLALAAIHGSIGDLHYAKGYSDLDTWLVLSEATVTDAARLRQFAKKCYRSLTDIYHFDPLQHHGHMIATAIDMGWYPENWLPLDTLRHACSMIPGKASLEVRVRDSAFDARQSFEELQELMHLRYAGQWLPETAFELKDYLSILMLAPALYLQAKGLYVAKQDSFQMARDHLPSANWGAMCYATQARSAWPYYRSRLVETVRPPNVFLTNALQSKQVRKAYRSTLESFQVASLGHAAELTQQMADDVELSTARFHALKHVPDEADLPLFVVNHPLARDARDYEETRDRYLASVESQRAVLGVYQYGNITYPGLSDLDLVLCVSETVEPIVSSRLEAAALSPLDRNILLHSPMVVPVSHIPYLPEFLIDATFRKIWETRDLRISLPARGATDMTFAKLAKLFETLFSDRIWVSEVLTQKTLDARWVIPSLKSVVYSCNIMESVTGGIFTWTSDYRAAIQELRANWFLEDSQYRQNAALRTVFRHGLQVIVRLMIEFDDFVRHSGWLTHLSLRQSTPVALPSLNATIAFEEQPMSDVSRIIANPQAINVPGTFWRFLSMYFEAVDNLDDRRRTPTASTEFEAYMQERINKIGQQMHFLKRHHMNYGGYLPWQLEQLLVNTRRYRAG